MDVVSEQSDATNIRLGRVDNPHLALGLTVEYLMKGPAFSKQSFGPFSQVLVGQINRRHYVLATRGVSTVGFVGYGLCSKAVADRWAYGSGEPTFDECNGGPCLLINAWMASDLRVSLALKRWFIRSFPDVTSVRSKRLYANGSTRIVNVRLTPGFQRSR